MPARLGTADSIGRSHFRTDVGEGVGDGVGVGGGEIRVRVDLPKFDSDPNFAASNRLSIIGRGEIRVRVDLPKFDSDPNFGRLDWLSLGGIEPLAATCHRDE
jgi:hypothetical protein